MIHSRSSVSIVPADYVDLLRRVDLFMGLDRVVLAKLAAHLEPLSIEDGVVLVRQGDAADAMYVISRGTFAVHSESNGRRGGIPLRILTVGDPVGEMALLTGDARSATVEAKEDGEVLQLDRDRFLELLRLEPTAARAIAATVSRRLGSLAGAPVGTSLAVVGLPVVELRNGEEHPTTVAEPSKIIATGRPVWFRLDRRLVGLIVTGLTFALGWVIPPPPDLDVAGWHTLAALPAAVALLGTSAVPDAAVALLLVMVWVLSGIAPVPVALGGFASGTWLLVLSILSVGAAIASTGLLYRAALWIAAHAPGGFLGQVTTLSLACVGLGAAIPDSVARTSLVAPATLEMADALGHPPGSRAAAGLAMAVQVGLGQVVALFLTSSSTALLAYALLPETARSGLTWGTWALRAAPVHVIMLLGLIVAIVFLYRPPPPTRLREVRQPGSAAAGRHAQRLALQRALLGKPSRQEYIAGGVAILLVVGFVTQPLHNVNLTWVAVTAFLLLAATGVLTADTLRSVNWNFVVLFGVLTSMSGVFVGVGLDHWLGDIVAQLLGPLAPNPVLFVAALAVLCFGLNLVVRLPAAAPLVTLAVAPVAGRVGIDPWIVVIVALTACNGFFLSHQSNAYQALYSGTAGRLFSHSQARPLAMAYYVVTLLALCASVPVWHGMGLL